MQLKLDQHEDNADKEYQDLMQLKVGLIPAANNKELIMVT